MARQRSKRIAESRRQESRSAISRSDDESHSDSDVAPPEFSDIDEDEKQLNDLVLGNETGFLAKLSGGATVDAQDVSEEEEAEPPLESGEAGGLEDVDDSALFFLDDGGAAAASETNALVPFANSEDEDDSDAAPAWNDSDDDRLVVSLAGNQRLRKLRLTEGEDLISGREYTKRLRRQFLRLHPTPAWAAAAERPAKRHRRSSASSHSTESLEEMELDDDSLSAMPLARLLQDAGSFKASSETTKRAKLRPEVINIQRTRDIPTIQPSAIASLSLHPQHPVILSSGLSSTLYLHHISATALPTPNPLLTSVHVRSTPIHTSAFSEPSGDKIIFAGRRRYFHSWDLESGTIQKTTRILGNGVDQRSMEKFKLSPCGLYIGLVGSARKGGGVINVLDATTTQWVAAARIEGRGGVADFAWWGDGQGMTIVGKGGEVGEWSIKSRTFVSLWFDDGAVGPTVVALGGRSGQTELGGDRWVAIGSSTGVVNIYDRRSWIVDRAAVVPKRPSPTRTFMQLTTPTSCLRFSPDGQLMVFASRWKKDALKLVHLPSCTVYRNWPTDQTPLGRISALAFSRESDTLAVGNEQGKIRLWDIRT